MKVFDSSSAFLPRESWRTIELPDDLQVMPIVCIEENVSFCHSDITGKWYVLNNHETGESTLIESGSWLDCCDFIMNPYYLDVPFIWGQPIKNKYEVIYIPIWETVKTGKFIEYDDGWVQEQTKEVYKIIRAYMPISNESDFNPYQKNNHSYFETSEYENLREMVSDLQCFTGKKF